MAERDGEWERQHLCLLFYGETDGLGICGCNQPSEAYELVLNVLAYFAQDHADRDYHELDRLIGTPGAVQLVLSQLDNAKLTDHSGTLAGGWLTDKGRAALEMMRRHEWYDDGTTPGVDQAGYPHDGLNECTAACWTPVEPPRPELSTAERMELIRKAAAEQCAAMTPAQRALDDAATDMLLYGETMFRVMPDGSQPVVFTDAQYLEKLGKIMAGATRPADLAGRDGPPWTHTFSQKPPCDLEDCCEADGPCGCNCHWVQPTHTITRTDAASESVPLGEAMRRALMAEDQIFLYGRSVGRSKALADAMAAMHEAWRPTPPVVPGLSRETTEAVLRAAAEAGVRPGGFE